MRQRFLGALALSFGLVTAAAAAPGSPPAPVKGESAARPVVDVYIGGYYGPRYYGPRYRRPLFAPHYRYYPWYRPWYAYEPPAYYYAPPPAVVVTQPPPQPVWTGTGVVWLFPGGAPQ